MYKKKRTIRSFELTLSAKDRREIDKAYDRHRLGEIRYVICAQVPDINRQWTSDKDITLTLSSWAANSIIGMCSLEDYSYPDFWSQPLVQKLDRIITELARS